VNRDFSDFISKVLDKTDIVTLISRYVRVEKKGNTHWACCPFHHETQPSFAVNEAKQFFHCFGCKESGNAISFLMKIENIEFIDALRMLAEQAGLEMPKTSGSFERGADKKQRETLYALMRDAARHYHDNLGSPRARIFNEYLEARKLPPNMVKRFGIGASLDFTEMLDFLQSKGYTLDQIKAAGICEVKDGRYYDVFGKRLMFPIIDNMGHVVAFGGRTLEKEVHFAKYRNSTQTDIFDKSKVIYGVNLLKKRKAEKPIDYVIMTEGYMDVIALHKAGFDTAVASMGTALTSKQARQLKLYSDLVYISYDGDSAGQKATMRGLDILRETGLIVKVVRLPEGLDPDDVIKRGGAQSYQKLLDEAIPLTAYKIEVLRSKYDLNDPDRKAMFAIEATKVVTALDNPVEQEQYLNYISGITGFTAEILRRQADIGRSEDRSERERPQERRDTAEAENQAPREYDNTIKFFMSSILQSCDYVDFDKNVSDALPDARLKRIYGFCMENRVRNVAAVIMSDERFDAADKAVIDEMLDYKFLPDDGRARFADVENYLYRKVLEKRKEELNKQYKLTGDVNCLTEIGRISKELQSYRYTRA
jgi:DNA primase